MTATLTAELPRTLAGRRLAGQVALVTGASRGLGRLIAGTLAGAGAAVGLVARSAGPLAQTLGQVVEGGGTAVAVTADVTDPDAMAAAVQQVSGQLGPIDVLVNNAGVTGPAGALWEVDPGDWWQSMEVNPHGALTCTQLVLPSMIARQHGRIVNITSQAGAYRWPMVSAYAVAKAFMMKVSGPHQITAVRAILSADAGCPVLAMRDAYPSGHWCSGRAVVGWSSGGRCRRDRTARGVAPRTRVRRGCSRPASRAGGRRRGRIGQVDVVERRGGGGGGRWPPGAPQ